MKKITGRIQNFQDRVHHKYNIGDIVKVVDSGQTYNSYTKAAERLGADRFIDGDLPETGDIGVVKNNYSPWSQAQHQGNFILIERLTDKQQFVMNKFGIGHARNPQFIMENDLFEI